MQSDVTFGKTLKTLRRTLGISQLALAAQLSSTQRHLSFLETGRSKPTVGFLRRLCSELNLSAAQRSAVPCSRHRGCAILTANVRSLRPRSPGRST